MLLEIITNYANILNNDSSKNCVSEFHAVRKVCDLPSVPLWDSHGQIASCVPVCVHTHVEFFACMHRFIIMLMSLNDIKCCVCHKNWWGKESTCTSLFHKYAYVLNLPMFCNWKYFEISLPNFLPQKSMLCGTAYRYTLWRIRTHTYVHVYVWLYIMRTLLQMYNASFNVYAHILKHTESNISEFDYVGLMAYLPYKWCI